MSSTHHHNECACPKCGHRIDAATNADEKRKRPSGGDLGVCAYCASLLLFQDDLSLREATPEYLDKLDDDTVRLLMAAADFVRKRIERDQNRALREEISR